jgi:peptidoglycan hydrolase-like protein with peptidoglycan-binding domain
MFLASKKGWAGIAFTLLTIGMLTQGFPRCAAASDSHQEGVAAFVTKNEITKMQEALRNKGHYRGKVDGVFGLRTRASIRAYQKAEHFSITGQVDARTADGLGVRPESNWNSSQSAGRKVEGESDRTGGQLERGKPSANIKWTKGSRRTSKTPRKPTVAAPASGRSDHEKTLQAENDNHPQ